MIVHPMPGECSYDSIREEELMRLCIDLRRNVIKADLGVAKKGQFPMALVENAHRYVISKNYILLIIFYSENSQQDQINSRDFSLLITRLIHQQQQQHHQQQQILIIIRLSLFKIQPFLQHISNNSLSLSLIHPIDNHL